VISGAHVILYSKNAEADRAFFRTSSIYVRGRRSTAGLSSPSRQRKRRFHPSDVGDACELYFMCSDLKAEMASLAKKGVSCSAPQENHDGVP